MRPEPVDRTRTPRYPTRQEVLLDPDLLTRHLPPGWRLTKELAAASSLFLAAGMAACGQAGAEEEGARDAPAVALVAPIFEHGEGRGATGCVAVSPPVFLSEEEALEVIREELATHGVRFTEKNVRVEGVTFPDRTRSWDVEEDELVEGIEEGTEKQPFDVDLRDPKRGISVEFVSRADYHVLGGPESMSTAQLWEIKKVAGELRKKMVVSRKGGRYFGTLYDPLASRMEYDRKKEEWTRSKTKSRDLLKKQVKELVDWLKAQGAI